MCLIALAAGTAGAWADTATATVKMTYINWNAQTTSYGEIAAGSTAKAGYNTISGGKVTMKNLGWGANCVTFLQVDASAISGTILKATLSADCSGSTDSKRTTTWGVGYNSSTWSADMTYSTADTTITKVGTTAATSSKSATTFNTLTFDITDAIKNDEDKVVTLLVYETQPAGGYIKNPAVEIEYSTGSTADYTVNYQYDGTTLKSETGTSVVGATISATAPFYVDKQKYYFADDATTSMTIAEGTNTLNVPMRKANIYSYTVTTDAATGSLALANDTCTEGLTKKVPYYKYINVDGTLYYRAANNKEYNYSITPTNDVTQALAYTKSSITNVVYYSEAEAIEGMTKTTGGSADVRCSLGAGGYSSNDVTVTTLEPGKYTFYGCVQGNKTATFVAKAGDTQIWTATTVGYNNETNAAFTLTTSATITISGGDNSKCLDYIYIVRTGDAEETIALGDNTYSTYCSAAALDFTDNDAVTAYTAAVNDEGTAVTLTEVTQVPANTGIILKKTGTATEATVKVIASAAEVENNQLVAVLEADKVDAATVNAANGYVLYNDQFCKLADTATGYIPAGKAYLTAPTTSKAKLAIGIPTAVSTIAAPTAAGDNAIYTLQGVRVAKPAQKGLYIVGGKKVLF